MTMTRGEEEDEEGGRAVLRLQPFLLRACQKEILGLTGHLSFTLFLPLRPPDRGYFPLPKEPEWEHARTGRRDPLEGVGSERAGRGRTTAVRRVQGVLMNR
jgi:hypothetical protein